MFRETAGEGFHEMLPGVQMKTLVHGERTLLGEFRMDAGAQVPAHHHPYEQTGYLVSGRLRFTVAGERFDAVPGSSWSIPTDVEHAAEVVEDAVVIEVFSPAREDYLPRT
jgi:quercetin dioxygenase-like cupin family protein